MRKGIATVSISGVLADKLDAIAAAGFNGIEIFDNDLVASPLSPREVASRCADLGLSIDLFQPVRDVQGVPPERFPAVLHRLRTKLAVMTQLGASVALVCSNVNDDSIADPDLTAEQLHRAGELAAEHGVTLAFEALAWGRHINRVGSAWDAVVRADHPAVTLAVDTFHLLARGDGGPALAGVPGARIGFLQVADAPLLDMNLLEWSRHFRCFPGQGTLDVTGVVAATLRAGYRGPMSLEVFSDVVRETDPVLTARDAMRSLIFLEDQLATTMAPAEPAQLSAEPARLSAAPESLALRAAAPPADRTDFAFLEIATAPGTQDAARLLESLGFGLHGRHRSKPVQWWRNGEAHVLINEQVIEQVIEPVTEPVQESSAPVITALGITASPVAAVAARAQALLWPAVNTTRGAGEATLPGITSPSGLHVFVSDTPGTEGDWKRDFVLTPSAPAGTWSGIDHIGIAVVPDQLNEEIGFFRTLFGLSPGPVEEFMEPHGRLRSRALRPARGDLRVVLNVVDTALDRSHPTGVNQIAFGCEDVLACVASLRSRGVTFMPVPGNYYTDLHARFALPPEQLELLQQHDVLYDRIGDGELLHAYTPVLETGFYIELLQRRGGYQGYGSANTHVRLAAQSAD
jgi:4-hydroxyphenylpyruvate dioxygenase